MWKTNPTGIALLALLSAGAQAHGIECDATRSGPLMLLECAYDPSGAVGNANIQIFAPSDLRAVYQSGRTDPQGRFAFVPDQPGAWRVVVDDQLGHREEILLTVADERDTVESASTTIEHHHGEAGAPDGGEADEHGRPVRPEIPLLYKVLFGLSLIWGAAGLWYGFKAGKTRPDAQPT